jgi:competence protein ComEC
MMRSCIAAVLILLGMMLGRDAISLRLLAVAGLLILVVEPEAIVGPSFQMTFAAIGAIIALHSTRWARKTFQRHDEHIIRRILRAAVAIMVTGLAVELSVMPYALYHFHRAGPYGVVANIIAIPLTEMVIMPLEAFSIMLDGIGLGRPLWVMTGWGLSALLGLAHMIANSTRLAHIPDMPGWSFALLSAGLAWVGLWTTRVRLLGTLPIAVGALAAFSAPTPDLLVSGDGQHLAVVDGHGTPLLLRERAGDYTRRLFAEASAFDGDPGDLGSRPYSDCTRDACVALLPKGSAQWRLLATRSMMRIDWERIVRACGEADIAVSDRRLPRGCKPRWLKLDRSALARTGGLAIYLGPNPRVETVAERIGEHPWAQAVR